MTKTVNKAQLFMDDFRAQKIVNLSKCMTVQAYDYAFERSRKSNGEIHNINTLGSIMNITLMIGSRDAMNIFYSRAKVFEPCSLSIIFSANFDDNDMMVSYSNAIIAEGTIVEIEENYDNDAAAEGQQMTITISILITGIKYTSSNGQVIRYNM